tara:strand:+ start:144 stop:482 length:339 start_codon:yes stop_codon:yes gene_type:complete
MEEDNFIKLIDQADKDLDAFPFWQKFKKACKANPIRGIDKLTPGRQAMLILWEANTQTKDRNGNLISISFDEENMYDQLQQLKDDLIGHFMNEEIDEKALNIFFQSIVKKLK